MDRKSFLRIFGLSPFFCSLSNLNDLHALAQNLKTAEKQPVLFLGHGSPMNAIGENEFVRGFRKVSETSHKPVAILCISAHWYTKGTKISTAEMPETIYDFHGFPKELYQVKYPAKGHPALARETEKLLSPTAVELDEKWGLDHGAWSVLKHLFTQADVPVFQMSIDYTMPAQHHFELAQRLRSLREKGVLIVGSGNIIHNLRMVDFRNLHKDNYGYDWAIEARETLNHHLLSGDFQALVNYQKLSKAVQLSIPSPDHYLPLIYALGLKSKNTELELFNDKLVGGSLSMTSLKTM